MSADPVNEHQPGRATLIGSWPGADIRDAVRTSLGELGEPPHLPVLPELPARGPGADLIGRAAGMLVDLPVDLQPSGWRLVDRPGRDLARTRAWLRQDLDVLAEVADGYVGPLKVQVAGPWTLAASLWLPRLERAVVDPGACRDLVESLAEGVSRHLAEVAALVPGATLVLQLDEPSITGVLSGTIPTASGFGRLRAVPEQVVVDGLATVLAAATAAGAGTVLHCCAHDPPVPLLARAGMRALSLDVDRLGRSGWERLAEVVDGGTRFWAGVSGVPGEPEGLIRAWSRLGLPREQLAEVVLSPPCGLAGSSVPAARQVLATTVHAAGRLAEFALG